MAAWSIKTDFPFRDVNGLQTLAPHGLLQDRKIANKYEKIREIPDWRPNHASDAEARSDNRLTWQC
jgi:hypothetical protein